MPALLNRRQFSAWLAASALASRQLSNTIQAAEPTEARAVSPNLTQANNDFAFALLKRLSAVSPADNHFFSPFSIESALAIAMEGARGQTAAQMGMALQFPRSLQADAAWDMETFRQEYDTLTKNMKPSVLAGAFSRVADVKNAIEKLNARLKQLSAAKNNAEWDKTFAQRERLLSQSAKSGVATELSIANSLWVDQSYGLSRAYQQTIQKFYGSSAAHTCDFQNKLKEERARINSWIESQTHNKIREAIPPSALSTDTRLVIANAIYFKGDWVESFEESATAPAPFTRADGNSAQVNMMSAPHLHVGSYAAFQRDGTAFKTPRNRKAFANEPFYPDDDGFQALELPYQGDRLSIVLLLPRRAGDLNRLVESMTTEKFAVCRAAMEGRGVNVKLPKFTMSTKYDLIPHLQELGMQDAFSPGAANFSALMENERAQRLFISMVLHRATVEVNEKGTEAAATTVVEAAPISLEFNSPFIPEFTANHPFLAAIIHKQSGTILFIGKVESL